MMNTWNPAEIMERLNRLEAVVKSIPTPVDVEANPEGEASTDLTKLTVGDTIYAIPEGTAVEANPEEAATVDLTKLTVGDTVYGIPVGGVTYSTTEQKIGKWHDGSDLYMRTYTIDSGNLSWEVVNDSNLEIRGYVSEATYIECSSSSGYHRLNPGCNYGGSSVNFVIDKTGSTTYGKATLYTTLPGGGPSMRKGVATIIYTKVS